MVCRRAKVLILCKTYPSPSAGYVETSCVAAMEEGGRLLRLYPVPFRLLEDENQFRKWQWIEADIEKAKDDHRQESHRIRACCESIPRSSASSASPPSRALTRVADEIHRKT
jgi:hypothetical protein